MMQAIEAEVSKQGVIKFCESIRLETGYRANVTLVENPSNQPMILRLAMKTWKSLIGTQIKKLILHGNVP